MWFEEVFSLLGEVKREPECPCQKELADRGTEGAECAVGGLGRREGRGYPWWATYRDEIGSWGEWNFWTSVR